jgi:hypothetical protein
LKTSLGFFENSESFSLFFLSSSRCLLLDPNEPHFYAL